jgi:hypothetical protein
MISFVTEVKKAKFFLDLAMKAQMGSRGIAVLLAVHGVDDQCHILATVFWVKFPVPILQKAGWA